MGHVNRSLAGGAAAGGEQGRVALSGSGRATSRSGWALRALTALLVAIGGANALPLTAHAAQTSADLSAVAAGPASGTGGNAFTYTVTVANAGPDAADGATFSVATPAGSASTSLVCSSSSGGAACPASSTLAAGTYSGAVPTLPAGGSVVLTLAGRYGYGGPIVPISVSVVATVSPPTGVSDSDPSNNTSTQVTALTSTADINVTSAVNVSAPTIGDTVTFSIDIQNNGPSDLYGLFISDGIHGYTVGATNGLAFTGTWSCDTAAPGSAPCPATVTSFPTSVRNASPDPTTLGISSPRVDVPSGTTLHLKLIGTFDETSCTTAEPRTFANQILLSSLGGLNMTGTSSAVSPQFTLHGWFMCGVADLGTTATTSSANPAPGSPMTLSAVFADSNGQTTGVPLTITLPSASGLIVDPASPGFMRCTVNSGTVACPQLSYDPTTREITGTVASITDGDSFTVKVAGTAGLVQGAAYPFSSSVVLAGDPVQGNNGSTSTYAVVNDKVGVSASMTLATAAPSDLTFTGTLTCQVQGDFPITVTVPSGSSTATALVATIWEEDSCSATLTAPGAPTGYAWASTPADYSLGDVSDPVTAPFTGALAGVSIDISHNGTVDEQTLRVGDLPSYRVTVTNTAGADLDNVAVTDPSAPGCDAPIGGLAVGESVTYSCDGPAVSGPLTNTASVVGTAGEAVQVSGSDSTTVHVADLMVEVSASPDVVTAGGSTTWTVTVSNTGDVAFVDVATDDSVVPDCAVMGLGPLGVEESVTYTCTSTDITAGFTNVVDAMAMTSGEMDVTGSGSAAVAVAGLSITGSASPTSVTGVGQHVTFSFTVTNTGEVPLDAVSVSEGVAGVAAVAAVSVLAPSVTCPVSSLAVGASTTCASSYVTTAADVSAGSVVKRATAIASDPNRATVSAVSAPVTARVTAAATSAGSRGTTILTGEPTARPNWWLLLGGAAVALLGAGLLGLRRIRG